jgi:hypothetical protein
LLADICLKAWQRAEYAHLAGPFPYKTDTRIKAVSKLLNTDGPLKAHRPGVQSALDELLRFEELRHFVAHGLLIVTPDPSGPRMQYRLYRDTKHGTEIGFLELSFSELTDASLKISELLHQTATTFRRIYFDLGWKFESS